MSSTPTVPLRPLSGRGRQVLKATTSSRADSVYSRLLHAINTGKLEPGQRVREVEVASWLGVSRTPVREALHRLQSEEIITKSDRGLIVPLVDISQIEALYDMREVLEGAAAALASRHASQAQIEGLNIILTDAATIPESDSARNAQMNKEFHAEIYRAANNRHLLKSLQSMQDAIQRLQVTTFIWPGRPRKALREHRNILRAIANRDSVAAEATARSHIREALRTRMQLLRKTTEASSE